jgi:membrane protease YdiL (CAAX protease family)
VIGLAVFTVGQYLTSPFILGNLRFLQTVPWALLATALILWPYWLYLSGRGWPRSTAEARRIGLRGGNLPPGLWRPSLLAGGCAMVALLGFRFLLPRLFAMEEPSFAIDASQYPAWTVLGVAFAVSLTAGVTEEAGLRGYLQGPLERRYGLWPAVLLTGVIFWAIHLSHDWVGFPHLFFHVAVSVALGALTSFVGSIRPAVVIHTAFDMIGLPIYAFRPAGIWEIMTARPIAETGWRSGDTLLIGLVAVFGCLTILTLARLRRLALAEGQTRAAAKRETRDAGAAAPRGVSHGS